MAAALFLFAAPWAAVDLVKSIEEYRVLQAGSVCPEPEPDCLVIEEATFGGPHHVRRTALDTGWCRSVALERRSEMRPPGPTQAGLCWYTREAWPSPATGTAHTEGTIGPEQALAVTAESDLVAFADGIETDALHLSWGQRVVFTVAPGCLRLLR